MGRMRVIFASGTPVLPEESRFHVGTAEDDFRFQHQWILPIKPRLEMEEGDPPSDWAVVSKILTAVSWNMRMDVSLGKTGEGSLVAFMNLPLRGEGYGQVKRLLYFFRITIFDTDSFLKIKLGASNCCIQFAGYNFDVDDDDPYSDGAKFKVEIWSGNARIKVDLSTHGVGILLRFLYCGNLDDATGNWKLSMELLKVAHFLGIHKLWVAIVIILREMEEPDMKTAVEVFQILVNSGKLETNKDLARKLVRILAKRSTEAVGDRAILHEYIRDRPFFDAWIDLSSAL